MARSCFGAALCLLVLPLGNVVNATIITADVAVLSPGGQYAPLAEGVLVSDWNRYYWYNIPDFAQSGDYLFWQYQHTGYPTWVDGIITFEVLTDGLVLMACTTRWGGGGNPSGGWQQQLTTREELEADGWVEFAIGLQDAELNGPAPYLDYVVFRRDSFAGETFTYRTEKYRPPTIIRSKTVVPEPVSLGIYAVGMAVIGIWHLATQRARL